MELVIEVLKSDFPAENECVNERCCLCAGIGLKGKSNALFDGNHISDGSGYGVWVQEQAKSTLQNNVIERNVRAGVVVTDSSDPTLSQNIIRDGKHAGLLIRHKAHGR